MPSTPVADDIALTMFKSPYVISMNHFRIPVLPDIVNALIMTSVFSAGNCLVFSGARLLHGMAMEGQAPAIFARCSRAGLPYYAVAGNLVFSFLGFLQVSNSSAMVLNWLVSVITACYLLNYLGTCVTYLHFYTAMKKQCIDRTTLPYCGFLQPYAGWYSVFGTTIMTLILGYNLFIDGKWDITSFFLNYTMIGVVIVTFVGWKVLKRTSYRRPGTADLGLNGLKKEIDDYEASIGPQMRSFFNRFFE